MEGDHSECISFDDNDNIVSLSGEIMITIPPLSKRTLSPIFRRRIPGLVLLPSNSNFKCLEYKEESKKESEPSKACDDRNNVIETMEEFSQSEKSPEKVTTEEQKEEISGPSKTESSTPSPVGISTPLKTIGAKNAGRIVLRCHDEKVLAWRKEVEKFREHLKNNRRKSTFGSLEEEQSVSKGKVENIVPQTETKPYSNSEKLNSEMNTEKIDGKEVEKISDPPVENIVRESRSSESKVGAESPETKKEPEKITTMLQPKKTFAGSELTAHCSDPSPSSKDCTSPTEEIDDQPLDTSLGRCFQEKLKKCHDLLREFKEIKCEYERVRPENPVSRRLIMQREQISQMKKTTMLRSDTGRLNAKTDYLVQKAEKMNEEKTSSFDSNLSCVDSASKILSESYVISENLNIGKKVKPTNVLESVEELPEFYTYDDFKTFLLFRGNRAKYESDSDVKNVNHFKDIKSFEFLPENIQKLIVLNSTFLGVR